MTFQLFNMAWFSQRSSFVLAIGLGTLAAITNLFTIPMLANTDLVLGGVFTMIAAIMMPARYALLASLTGTLGLAISWQHGWGFLWFPLEVLFVNQMVRYKVHVLLADLIYWIMIGLPLVYLVLLTTEQLSSPMLQTILSKQVLNGYLYTLLASFLTMLPVIRHLPGTRTLPLPTLKTYLTKAFGMVCTICLLSYGLVSERNNTVAQQDLVDQELNFASLQLTNTINAEFRRISQTFSAYAELLEQGTIEADENVLKALLRTDNRLDSAHLLDDQGLPLFDVQRESFNKNLWAKPSKPNVDSLSAKQAITRHLVTISTFSESSKYSAYPSLVVSAPIYYPDQFRARGVLQGIIDLKTFELSLQNMFEGRQIDFVVFNEKQQVVFSSKALNLNALSTLQSAPQSSDALPLPLPGLMIERDQGAKDYFVAKAMLSQNWSALTLIDAEQVLDQLQARYLKWALFIVLASLVSVLLGQLIADLFTRPLLSVLKYDNDTSLQNEPPTEFHYDEQQQLHASLERKSKALKTYYNSLEHQVNTRTHELKVLNERMNRVLQSSSDGILEIGANGKVNFVNQALASWLDQTEAELVGQSVDSLLRPVDGTLTLSQCVHEARFNHVLAQGEGTLQLGSNLLELEFNASPSLHENGQIGAVIMLRNISNRKELQRSIELARELAEQAAQAKSDFVANMSHEIRTPLNAISGLIQLFERKNLSSDQRQYLRRMEHGSELLQSIVNDILDFSKIQSGHMELEQQAFDIEALVAHLRLLMLSRAKQNQLKLVCQVNEDVPKGLIGDPLRLTQILMNLLSNAIKFTHQGRVSLTVSQRPSGDDDKVHVRFEVSDTGIGIPSDKLSNLFNPFTQADTATTRQYGGTGLGLAISQRMVSLMGSQLEVSSILQRGSKFWFDIQMPVALPDQDLLQTPSSHFTPRANIQFYPQQVLIVEDNEVNLQITRLMLERIGLIPIAATDGEQALRIIHQQPELDLVLMDLQMPGQDGLQTTRLLRQEPQFNGLPVVALTAHATLADKKRCLQAGMQEHLSKPVNMNELIRVLSRFLRYKAAPVEESEVITIQAERVPEMIQTFLQKFGRLAEQLPPLVAIDALDEAELLVSKAIQAALPIPNQELKACLLNLQSEIRQQRPIESYLHQLNELLQTIK